MHPSKKDRQIQLLPVLLVGFIGTLGGLIRLPLQQLNNMPVLLKFACPFA